MAKFVPKANEDPMATLCRMVHQTTFEDLPNNVVQHAKRSILDTLAVTIGGSGMEGIPAVVDLVKDKGGKPESLIPFYGGRVPASEAGLALGPMARAMDFGDCHLEGEHCSEYTVPTLLASTGLKRKVTGKELITAYVVGQEVLLRIGIAARQMSRGCSDESGSYGGHYIFGATAAAGKLLDLTQEELENAEGIARGMTQPHDLAMYKYAVLMVRIHHGFVCQDAINACLLARKGITGVRQEVLTGMKGYLTTLKWETEPELLTVGLGETWEMLGQVMKPYSACLCTHTTVDGVLEQMKEHHFKVSDIAHIDLDQSSLNWFTTGTPKEVKFNPQTVPECQFSLPYVVATAAYEGDFFLNSLTPEAMARQDVRELMTRISIKEDSSLPTFAARVHIELKNGKKYSKEKIYLKGSPQNPFSDDELIDKLKKCVTCSAYKLSDNVVDSLINVLLNLEDSDDVEKDILLPLTPK